MPCVAQKHTQFDPKHLIEVKAHGGLRDIEGGDFRVQNGMPGVLQGGLNIIPRQFRVASQQRIPRFIVGQLFQNCGHRNPCAFDNRLAATDTRIDFNTLAHIQTIRAPFGNRKRPIFPSGAAALWHHHSTAKRVRGNLILPMTLAPPRADDKSACNRAQRLLDGKTVARSKRCSRKCRSNCSKRGAQSAASEAHKTEGTPYL